ncbi:hypothetical protein [Azospirillum brasilense]|nr:hypothetical protein [Azospirillum brasilense]MDW7595010.1 hypothetical protein [Azospirillum brasilense]TVZ62576.1 hypothetical protein OH82_00904 [Azospirillum brasilense]TWB76820.1 hypothetical protein FBZ81_11065 [Azospirillum brasilense]
MLRTMTVATLAVLAFAAPAEAQRQEYPSWVYEEMVPTGPHMRRMEEAQPIPGPRPSHWGAMGNGEQFRAGSRGYGTDPARATPSYSRTNSLTPPVRDGRGAATAVRRGGGGDNVPGTPREVTLNPEYNFER